MAIPDLTQNGGKGLFGEGRESSLALLKNVGTMLNTQVNLQMVKQNLLAQTNYQSAALQSMSNAAATVPQTFANTALPQTAPTQTAPAQDGSGNLLTL
jgi:hypothetical protein